MRALYPTCLAATLYALLTPTIGFAAAPVQVINPPTQPVPVTVQGNATVQGSVTVTNTSANPVGVQSADEPGRGAQPFQIQVFGVPFDCSGSPPATALTVPAGSELVIEFVSAAGQGTPGVLVTTSIVTTVNGTTVSHQLATVVSAMANVPSGTAPFDLAQPLRLYADPGTTVKLAGCFQGSIAGTVATVSISGYLLRL